MTRLQLFTVGLALAAAGTAPASGLRLEGVAYPYPVQTFAFRSQQQELEVAFMDVAPAGATRGTVLLLHGKNFSGAYFGETIAGLRAAGFRVLAPDQVGFGKSSKPAHYHYTFHQLARNTAALLDARGLGRVHVLGHSMGGMLATRFALMFPGRTRTLTLLNPIGLEDWQAKGVPYTPVDTWYQRELGKTAARIRAYQLDSYYDGRWRDAYDPWVALLARFLESPEYPRMAWNQALTYDMIFTQPVVHEFPRLAVPTLLVIGGRDRTALGKGDVSPAVRATLGDYPALGRAARDAIPGAQLVELEGVGHLPHVEAFGRFFPPYRTFLRLHSR